MLHTSNGDTHHINPAIPHFIKVPSKREVQQAWAQIKKRLKESEEVKLLDQYLSTR